MVNDIQIYNTVFSLPCRENRSDAFFSFNTFFSVSIKKSLHKFRIKILVDANFIKVQLSCTSLISLLFHSPPPHHSSRSLTNIKEEEHRANCQWKLNSQLSFSHPFYLVLQDVAETLMMIGLYAAYVIIHHSLSNLLYSSSSVLLWYEENLKRINCIDYVFKNECRN